MNSICQELWTAVAENPDTDDLILQAIATGDDDAAAIAVRVLARRSRECANAHLPGLQNTD